MTQDDASDDTIDSSTDGAPPSAESLAGQLLVLLPVLWESHAMRRRVIGIAGESGSGKSVTADTLARLSNASGVRTTVINQDNYFVLPPRTNHENRCKDLTNVGPHEVHMSLIAEHVDAFRARRNGVVGPLVDYAGNRFVTQTYDFAESELLIVEGTYVLQLPDLDARIFLQATHEETEERRRARNRDLDEPIVAQVLAIEHEIIAAQAVVADVLIDATFNIVRG